MNNLLECKWIETVMASFKVQAALVYLCSEGRCVALPYTDGSAQTYQQPCSGLGLAEFELPDSAAHLLLTVTPFFIVPFHVVIVRNG